MHRVVAALSLAGLLVAGCGGTKATDSASTAAETAASTTTATTTTPPPPVAESALDGLLLTPADVDAATGVTGMAVAATANALATDIQVAADAPPEKIACVGVAGTAEAQAYAGAGSTAVRDQVLAGPRRERRQPHRRPVGDPVRVRGEGVGLRHRLGREVVGLQGIQGQRRPPRPWDRSPRPTASSAPPSPRPTGTGRRVDCQRALTAANNVVVEASACSAAAPDAAVAMAGRIAAKVAQQ